MPNPKSAIENIYTVARLNDGQVRLVKTHSSSSQYQLEMVVPRLKNAKI